MKFISIVIRDYIKKQITFNVPGRLIKCIAQGPVSVLNFVEIEP